MVDRAHDETDLYLARCCWRWTPGSRNSTSWIGTGLPLKTVVIGRSPGGLLGRGSREGRPSWCDSASLVSQTHVRKGVLLSKGSGISRTDRRRNARKASLRGLVPRDGVVLGIDLGEDKQALALVDHDVRVLWRKSARVKAHELGPVVDAAVAAARKAGPGPVTVACEPTGP